MAKYGEGDKRWIVEERVDGTNVHNWHWAETDCLQWSRSFLSDALQNLPVLSGEGGLHIRITTLDHCDGEAYVNIRKGKIIPGYELSLSFSWHGEARDPSSDPDPSSEPLLRASGSVHVPYLSDENADEDPDLRVSFSDDGPLGRRLKDAFLAHGKPVVLQKIRLYVQAMARGGPAKDDLEVKKKPPSSTSTNAPAPALAPASAAAKEQEKKQQIKKKSEGKEGFRTISIVEKFHCQARDVYEILMDENRWKGFTQSNAKISKEVSGEFSLFDGSITGINQELQDGKLIVQKWRFGSWPDGVYSTVRMTFEEPEPGVTIIRLKQTDVPEEDRYGNSTVVENTERGWKELIFHKIRAVFGFGI